MRIQSVLLIMLLILLMPISLHADNGLSHDDIKLIELLQKHELIDKDIKLEDITPKYLEYIKYGLSEAGIDINDIGKPPDIRFSTPIKTWELYKLALVKGDSDLALKCLTGRTAKLQKEAFNSGEKKWIEMMKKEGRQMQGIQKIVENDKTAKYRLRSKELYGGEMREFTYYIYFVNILGNWKIEQM